MIMHEGTAAAKKILNTQYSCFSLGVRKFGGKFPFFSKVFLEELRCSTRGVQGHVRAWAAWIYYDLERDPSKHLLNTSWQSEENTVDCSLSEHTIQYFVCPSEYTWLYLNFMNNTPNFGNSLDVTWKLHQARHERVSGLSRIDFACRSKLLASQSVEDRTDIASWRLILLERFKIFHFSTISRVSVFLPCYSVTLPSVAISKPGKSELVRFPSFWICGYVPDVCGICGGFAGNFLRFHGSFSDCSQQSPDT